MWLNGGLYYYGLLSDPELIKLAENSSDPQPSIDSALRRTGERYGLIRASVGQIVYEAVRRDEVEPARIGIGSLAVTKPQLTEDEQKVLESLARILIPKGGSFKHYQDILSELTRFKKTQLQNIIKRATKRLDAANVEQAIVRALATGILDPDKLFGDSLPFPMRVIMDSVSYQIMSLAATRHANRPYLTDIRPGRRTEEEKLIIKNYFTKIRLNGGLFWRGWENAVAVEASLSTNQVSYIVKDLRRTFNTPYNGLMFYYAHMQPHPYRRVVVKLPPKVDVSISELELAVMTQLARTVIPTAGYHLGYLEDVARNLYYHKDRALKIIKGIMEKTETINPGQAVTYFIAHGLVVTQDLHLDPSTPALEAIIKATRRQAPTI